MGGNNNMTWAEFVVMTTIKRDRNNPSVIMWSIGNEIACVSAIDDKSIEIAKKLLNIGKKLDLQELIMIIKLKMKQLINIKN